MQYVLIQLEGAVAWREALVTVPGGVDALTSTQLPALTTTTLQSYIIPGQQLYQCVRDGQVVGYKTLEGQDITFTGGSSVINANPATPAWDVPEVADV